jgi:hypothetical protein
MVRHRTARRPSGDPLSKNGQMWWRPWLPILMKVIQSAGQPYDQDAIDSMKRARFQPALDKAGQPVDCEITWRLDYSGR